MNSLTRAASPQTIEQNLTRKERDELRKRREILEAAGQIFAVRGFHSTTMAQISKQSQYPLGTIYKYFPGKKEIYHDLVINKVRDLGKILGEIRQRQTLGVEEKLLACLKAQAQFYKSNQEVVKIYISERSNIDAVAIPKLNERVNSFHDRMVSLFQDLFEQGIQAGCFKPYNANDMAQLYADIVHSAAWAGLFREDETPEKTDQRLAMIFDMFTNGITQKKS